MNSQYENILDSKAVIPAKAGNQLGRMHASRKLGSRLRGNDECLENCISFRNLNFQC
jgi:hypothetical protein